MKNNIAKSLKRKQFHIVCFLFGHNFDPIHACSSEDEYCKRCGKKCHEHDRWFDWHWYVKWKLLPVKRAAQNVRGKKDIYSF